MSIFSKSKGLPQEWVVRAVLVFTWHKYMFVLTCLLGAFANFKVPTFAEESKKQAHTYMFAMSM